MTDGGATGDDAWAVMESAREAFRLGHYAETLDACTRAAAGFQRVGDRRGCGFAANLAGSVDLERGDYEAAARRFVRAEEHFRAAGDEDGVARARSNLGLVHWRIHDLERAREDLEAALAIFERGDDLRAIGNALNTLGLVAEEGGDLEEAAVLYERALVLVTAAGDRVFEANVLANLADVSEASGRAEEAWQYAEAALALRLRTQHARGIVGSRVSLARLALARGDVARAEEEVARGVDEAIALGLRKHHADLVDLAAQVAAARGAWETAYHHARGAAELRRALQGEELARRIGELRSSLDVAEARRLAEVRAKENAALREAAAAAEAASRARTEFVGVMSHEIRRPLTTVVGTLELLTATGLDARQAGLVETARGSIAALVALADEVMDLASLDTGALRIEAVPLEVDALLAEVADGARHRAADRGLAFSVERAPGLPARGLGDPQRLRQVLQRLLSNAVKFTPAGSVTLAVAPTEDGVRFTVADTGVGIAPAALSRIFDPFVQADSSSTRPFGGSGLGLAVAHRLTQAMGGSLAVVSTVGVGSTFTLTLPFPPAPAPTVARPAPVGPILLVDDDDDVAGVIGALLEHLGHEVTRASTAAEALAAEGPFRGALLDVHMPGMDGLALARALRARRGPDFPLVGLSGAASAEARARGLAAGMDDYLAKPVTLAALQRVIEGWDR